MNFRRRWRTNESGFTLLELLVGLTLWVLVSMMMLRVFHTGLSLWKRLRLASPQEQEARVILDQMAREWRQAIDVPGFSPDPASGALSWTTLQQGRIEKVTYESRQNRLWKVTQTLSPMGRSMPRETPLTEGPANLTWDYAYAAPQGVGVQWRPTWTPASAKARPCGLRVQLTLEEGSGSPLQYCRTLFVATSEALPWAR